jgi:predicted amidohydrolase YtcJ
MQTRLTSALVVVFVGAIAGAAIVVAQSAPTLVIVNGRIFTGMPAQKWADALAITGDRISFVGTNDAVRVQATAATRVIDLAGRMVVPGFNDAHAHPGAVPGVVRLEGPPAVEHDPTFAEILQRLRAAVDRAPKNGWIFGEIGAAVLDDPAATRFALDKVAPDRLVMLEAWTGHGTLFNTSALRHLRVGDEEPDPPGGFYRRMPGTKTITGWAHEYAEYRLRRLVTTEPDAESQRAAFRGFANEAATLGVTSVQAMMTSIAADEAARLLDGVDLPVRLRLIDFPLVEMKAWRAPVPRQPSSSRLTLSGTKWILDGTPIERLMFIREPYADRDARGRSNFAASDVRQFLERARAAREQPILHAVGDAAIDLALDALEASGGESWQALRPRIEHGDLLRTDQFAKAKRLGVVIVQNPSHLMIGPELRARLGDARVAHAQLLKSTLAFGIPVAIGSDGPMSPFLNLMFAAIAAANPSEALTREQVVSAYTRGSAFAELQEQKKGTLAPGMLADLAVLSQDIFTAPVEALPRTTSVLTIVGGKVVHETK